MPWGRLKARRPAILPQRRGSSRFVSNVEQTLTDSRRSDERSRGAWSGTANAKPKSKSRDKTRSASTGLARTRERCLQRRCVRSSGSSIPRRRRRDRKGRIACRRCAARCSRGISRSLDCRRLRMPVGIGCRKGDVVSAVPVFVVLLLGAAHHDASRAACACPSDAPVAMPPE